MITTREEDSSVAPQSTEVYPVHIEEFRWQGGIVNTTLAVFCLLSVKEDEPNMLDKVCTSTEKGVAITINLPHLEKHVPTTESKPLV